MSSMLSVNSDSGLQTGADFIINALLQLGINTMFGVPGGAIEPLFNAIARSNEMRLVIARHECGSVFMADGFYRETNKLSVVCSTTGPGATNLITGVASAYVERIPMLVITAQTPLPKFGRGSLQDSSQTAVDITAMFETITAYNTLVSHVDQLHSMLVSAISCALSESRPVHLSIPSDVMRAQLSPRPFKIRNEFKAFDPHTVSLLCDQLSNASRIVFCIGENVKSPKLLYQLISKTNASFVCTPVGKSYANEHHPKFRGVIGFAGHDSATHLLSDPEIDLIIAVGTSFDELSTGGWANGLCSSKVYHIDDRIDSFTRSENACHVFGAIDTVLSELLRHVESLDRVWFNSGIDTLHLKDVIKCHHDCEPVRPQYLMRVLSELSDEVRMYIDAGNSWAWATHYLLRNDIVGNYRIGMGFGSMGWSVGASIGSALAARTPTVCIVGDGSYLMSAQEITVAVQFNLPIVFVILNDSALGMVYHGQRLGNQESIGWELPQVDFAVMAQAVGARGIVVNNSRELDAVCVESLFTGGPVVVDVRIDRNEVPPMGDRVKGLSKSVTPGA